MKKLLSILLVVVLLLAYSPYAFADTHKVTGKYFEDMLTFDTVSYSMDMDTDWFSNPSSEYNHNIAKLSLLLAISAFKSQYRDLDKQDENIRAFMKEAGFEAFEDYEFDIETTRDTVANAFGLQKLRDDKGEYCLIAVSICGAGYGNEWVSNFTIGSTDEHIGFTESAVKVYERLNNYIENNAKNQRVKLWMTGFSRSAAICNALGNLILTSEDFNPDDVFVYTFATPNNTKNQVDHAQIFNICNGFDIVTKIPLYEWGYNKHGNTLYLPTPSTTSNYPELVASAEAVYKELIGNNDEKIAVPERNWLSAYLIDLIRRAIPNNDVYASGYQDAIAAAWEFDGNIGEKINVFIETAKRNNCDTSGFDKIKNETEKLLSASLNNAASALMDEDSTNAWPKVFSEGPLLMHEHMPAVYLSWLFSSDDPEELYDGDSTFTRVGVIGDANVRVVTVNPVTKEETIIQDTVNGIIKYPIVPLDKASFFDLPTSEQYKVYLSPIGDDSISAYCEVKKLACVSSNYMVTNGATIFNNEYLEMDIPIYVDNTGSISVKLNGILPLRLEKVDTAVLEQKMFGTNSSNDMGSFEKILVRILSYLPDILGILIVFASVVIIFFRRIIKGPSTLRISCSTAGKVLFIIVAVVSAVCFVYIIYETILYNMSIATDEESDILSKIVKYFKIVVLAYGFNIALCQLFMCILSIQSISFKLARNRLFILSILMLIIIIISLLVIPSFDTIDRMSLYYSFVPILALIAIYVANYNCYTYVLQPSEEKIIEQEQSGNEN